MGLSKELGPDGIRVNAVAPAWSTPRSTRRWATRNAQRDLIPTIPLRRAGAAEEIAAAIAWLLSPEASYTTGTVLRVAGGR